MSGVQIEGLSALQKKLKDNVTLDDVKRVVRVNGQRLENSMDRNANFKKGYSTGATRRSLHPADYSNGGMTVTVEPKTEYSPYVEYGTRFMEAQPFVKPAFETAKVTFKNDLNKLMK